MELNTTHIAEKLESIGSAQRTPDVSDPFAHVDVSFVHSHEVQVIANIIGGNLLYCELTPGVEGDFYFVEFDNQKYLVGFKDESRSVIDEELFQSIIPMDEEAQQLQIAQLQKVEPILHLIMLGTIVTMICLAALLVALFGAVILKSIFFRSMLLILIFVLILIAIGLSQLGRKLDKHQQKAKTILDEINRSHSLLVEEMQRKLKNIMA